MLTQNLKSDRLLLRVSEAAEMLSVARSKAYAMVQTGELPSVRLGKSVRIPVRSLNEYVERKTEEALSV
jgi:excisionase family DNA binding protein